VLIGASQLPTVVMLTTAESAEGGIQWPKSAMFGISERGGAALRWIAQVVGVLAHYMSLYHPSTGDRLKSCHLEIHTTIKMQTMSLTSAPLLHLTVARQRDGRVGTSLTRPRAVALPRRSALKTTAHQQPSWQSLVGQARLRVATPRSQLRDDMPFPPPPSALFREHVGYLWTLELVAPPAPQVRRPLTHMTLLPIPPCLVHAASFMTS
jgi:hypothetical protein